MLFEPARLMTCLQTRLGVSPEAALCVAYSGGLDSTVLLHALARLVGDGARYKVRAVHVDHRLHADSARWSQHCEQQARQLNIEFVGLSVTVDAIEDLGLEAAARQARYDALRSMLWPGEYLLTAHHADDQLETMLFALMRGAGLSGLSAMPPFQSFGPGWLGRPLLDFTRAELERWARSVELQWLSDPANENCALDRNYLRHRIIPALRDRWPAAAHTAARSAEHLQAAGRALDQLAELDAAHAVVGARLSVERLQALDLVRRNNLLRYWIRRCGARPPNTRRLATIAHDLLSAGADRIPCVEWDGRVIRRYRGLLYCERQLPPLSDATIEWRHAAPLTLPSGLGRLRMAAAPSGGISAACLTETLRVQFRAGGESLQPAGDRCHRKLKKLLQSAGVLPWWRERLPLVYCGDQLVAVGDLWLAAEVTAHEGEPGLVVVWEDRPAIAAVGG